MPQHHPHPASPPSVPLGLFLPPFLLTANVCVISVPLVFSASFMLTKYKCNTEPDDYQKLFSSLTLSVPF